MLFRSSDVTISGKPTNIVYGLADNQLKINLNVTGIYNTLSKTVYLNFTLAYLDAVDYNAIVTRTAGWYLFPRWLYWSYGSILNNSIITNTVLDMEGTLDNGKVTETISYNSYCSQVTTSVFGASTGAMQMQSYFDSTIPVAAYTAEYNIDLVDKPSQVSFKFYTNDVRTSDVYVFRLNFWKDGVIFGWHDITVNSGVISTVMVDSPLIQNADKLQLFFSDIDSVDVPVNLFVDDFTISYANTQRYMIVARGFDQQRGLVEIGTGLVIDSLDFRLTLTNIDYRIEAYEIYVEIDTLFKKRLEFTVADTTWVDNTTYLSYTPVSTDWIDTNASGVETLNTNYGLGYDIWAYNHKESTYGFIIYKEVEFRGRNYLARFDESLYYSHLAGSGLLQSDSFPYNDDGAIGYIIVSNSDIVNGIAVSALNELVVYTNKRAYLYLISASSTGIFFRRVRAINGSFGLGSVNGLVTALDGKPEDLVLFWTNKWGAHIYSGGIQPPQDVTRATHSNYWRNLTDSIKAQILSFYNPQRREFWMQIDDVIVLYELMTKSFRKYKFPFKIINFVGIKDNYAYVTGNDNKIYKLDPRVSTKLSAFIVTHYSTDTIMIGQYPVSAWEFQHKILQDIFVAFKNSTPGYVDYTIIADESIVTPTIGFSSRYTVEVLPSPLLIRYGKVKIKLSIPETSADVKEFGYSFSVPGQGRGSRGANIKTVTGVGQSSGMSAGVNY